MAREKGGVEEICLEFIERSGAGEPPTLEEYVLRRPDAAAEVLDRILSFWQLQSAEREPLPEEPTPAARRGIQRAFAALGIPFAQEAWRTERTVG